MNKALHRLGEYTLLMTKAISLPDRWNMFFKQLIKEIYKLGVDSIWIVIIISIFIGTVIAIQISLNISSPLIPKFTIGYTTREIILLEFSSSIMCLILAGKIGSNIASEIGTMRVTEQIDAMDMMGVNSANYLILPKIAASTVFNPLLMLFSFMLGLVGGAMIILFTGIVTMSQYVDGLHYAFRSYYIFYSMIKMSVFSFVITSISSFYGYNASGGALGVGSSSTKAIVVSSVMILVANLVITQLMLG